MSGPTMSPSAWVPLTVVPQAAPAPCYAAGCVIMVAAKLLGMRAWIRGGGGRVAAVARQGCVIG